MAKLICETCGELPILVDVPKNIEGSETDFARFGKKLVGGAICAKCKGKIKLVKGKLLSKSVIKKAEELRSLMNQYSNSINFDDAVHDSNEIVISKIIKEMNVLGSLFYHKSILFYVLVGENTPDGCITYNTRTIYSGIYTMFPDVKNSLLENSLDAIKNQQLRDQRLPANKINNLLNLKEDNEELKKKIKTIENEYQQKLKNLEIKINNQYSEMSQKQHELNHFKELYGKLKGK